MRRFVSPGAAQPRSDPGESKPVPSLRSEHVRPAPALPPREQLGGLADLPRVEWDCSPGATGVCLSLECEDNMIGVQVRANATLVIGAGGGGRRTEGRQGVVIPPRVEGGALMTLRDVEERVEQAAVLVAELGDALYEACGTTCKRDMRDGMLQAEVAVGVGCTRQRVQAIERGALVKLRRRRDVQAMADWDEEVDVKVMAPGCSRRGVVRHDG